MAYELLYTVLKRRLNEAKGGTKLCSGIFLVCLSGPAVMYGQPPLVPTQASGTPWEPPTLVAVLLVAVGALYRERLKDKEESRQLAIASAAAIATATAMMVDVTKALERLSVRIEAAPQRQRS